jgi:hypothetical protein
MNLVIPFALAFASTLIIGAIARYGAGFFACDRASRVAAFGVALGYAVGRFSYAGPAKDMPSIAAALGAIAALIVAWAWLIRRGPGELTGVDG